MVGRFEKLSGVRERSGRKGVEERRGEEKRLREARSIIGEMLSFLSSSHF